MIIMSGTSRTTIKRTIQFYQIKIIDSKHDEVSVNKIIHYIKKKLSPVFDERNIDSTIYYEYSQDPKKYLYLKIDNINNNDELPICGRMILARKDELPMEVLRTSDLKPLELRSESIGVGEQSHFIIFKENIGQKSIFIVCYENNPFGARISGFANYLENKSKFLNGTYNKLKAEYYPLISKDIVNNLIKGKEIKNIKVGIVIPKWLESAFIIEKSQQTNDPIKGLKDLVYALNMSGFDETTTYTLEISLKSRRRKFLNKKAAKAFIGRIVDIVLEQFEGDAGSSPFRSLRITVEANEIELLKPLLKFKIVNVPLKDTRRKIIDSNAFYNLMKSAYKELVKPYIDKVKFY